jgi:ribosomal protein L3
MEGLFPIVRRKRVPLVVEDTPPVMVGNVEPVTVVAVEPAAVVPLVNAEPQSAEPVAPAIKKERRAKRQE